MCADIPSVSLQEQVPAARKGFPVSKRRAEFLLVISHAKKTQDQCRDEKADEASGRGRGILERPSTTKQASALQDAWIWLGMQLVGYMDRKRGSLC